MYDAAIFDLDGTLLDTEAIAMARGVEVFADYGHALSPGFLHQLIGKDEHTGSAILTAHFGAALPVDKLRADWAAACHRHYETQGIPLRPGVLDILAALDAIGLKRAIATSSRRERALWKLECAGLGGRFPDVVGLHCIANPKPAPDPFLHAARLMGVAPARCVAFEDSDTGAASAMAAGMVVVQVPDLQPTEGQHATLVAPDLMAGARAVGLLAAETARG